MSVWVRRLVIVDLGECGRCDVDFRVVDYGGVLRHVTGLGTGRSSSFMEVFNAFLTVQLYLAAFLL